MPVLFWAALALSLGCGSPADTIVISSDPELSAEVAALLPDLAARAGLELTEPVRVERRSREELETYLRAKLDEELPREEAARLVESYALLGLVPEDLDLHELLLSLYTEQVAGFYDPDSTTLFVMDDQPEALLRTVLVHELVHAVQDQAADLSAITDRERGNDRSTAAQAAIEGHATLVMLEYFAEQMRGEAVDLSSLQDFSGQVRPALEGMREQYPALAGAPLVIQESLLFPYLEGAVFVQALWRNLGGRPAPFGEWLPLSTEHVLEPTRFFGEVRDDPTEILLVAEGGESPGYSNTLGAMETGILLAEWVGPEARAVSTGWDGDRYALYGDPGERSLVWVTVWDDAASRDRFVATVGSATGRLSRPAVLEAVELDGRPGTVLRVGSPPPVAVELRGGR